MHHAIIVLVVVVVVPRVGWLDGLLSHLVILITLSTRIQLNRPPPAAAVLLDRLFKRNHAQTITSPPDWHQYWQYTVLVDA